MGEFDAYPPGSGLGMAAADLIMMTKAAASFQTQKMTIEELDKHWATVAALAAAATGSFTFAEPPTPSATQADETWLDTTDGSVYVSTGTGTGNWVFVYKLVLNSNSTILDRAGGESVRDQTILNMDKSPSFYFPGDGGNILIPDNPNINPGTNDFSISGRFRANTTPSITGNILSKRSGVNEGYQIQVLTSGSGGLLRIIADTGTQYVVQSDGSVLDGLWHGFDFRAERGVELSLYLDGVKQADTEVIDSGSMTNAIDLSIGYDAEDSTEPFDGNIGGIVIYNRAVEESEAISDSSNPLTAIDRIDQYGSNIELITGWTNSDFDTHVSSGVDISSIISDGTGAQNNYSSNFTSIKGVTYAFDFTIGGTPGTDLSIKIATATSLNGAVFTSNILAPGDYTLIWLATESSGSMKFGFRSADGAACNFSVTNWFSRKLGATLDIDAANASLIQAKDQANGTHGLLTNVELTNTPVRRDEQDIYKEVADNDTFDVPENTASLKITYDFLTLDAGKFIRIGTTDGGQEVVADVSLTAQPATDPVIVLDNFKAGDTLHIGSDGGAAWTTADITIYVEYTVLQAK